MNKAVSRAFLVFFCALVSVPLDAQTDYGGVLIKLCSRDSGDSLLRNYRWAASLASHQRIDGIAKWENDMDELERQVMAKDSSVHARLYATYYRVTHREAIMLGVKEPNLTDSQATTKLFAQCRDLMSRAFR